MKVLLFLDELVIGGTLVNAIELAGVLRKVHGYDVVLFAGPGPMLKLAEQKQVPFLPAPFPYYHPSRTRMLALREVVRRERPDLVWAWDPFACFDAYWGVHVPMRIPVVTTIMVMQNPYHLPQWPITTYGTPELVDKARAMGGRCVELMLPPVDEEFNAPGVVNPGPFRERCGIADTDITLVTVSRLAELLKGESLRRTIHAVGVLGRDLPLRFVIVGDGAARSQLEHIADKVNSALGRPAIIFAGPMLDPRPAYAAADIVVGMGGSSLRGMAFGKPVIVVGEQGFSAPFTPQTAASFYYKGFYGVGTGSRDNTELVSNIRALAERPDQFAGLGAFARQFVVENFSLPAVSAEAAGLFHRAVHESSPYYAVAADAFRSAALYLRYRRFSWRYLPVPQPATV
ncbi:MAG TPA: glycosyltransferase family 4 protein [Bryobacteraceae bacterium]|nr:glycosyltransferase family 4 protein [Bryobacteraceae bacterium]